nr:3-oxoacyl-[acyl-carrier-protein] synthase II, chloroplastic-like [Ipomoea batatas]
MLIFGGVELMGHYEYGRKRRLEESREKKDREDKMLVVTGLGVASPLGHEPNEFYENLLEGVSGISEIEAFDYAQYSTRIAGEIKSFSTDGWVAPKLSKRLDRFMLFMLTAGKKALVDGGITDDVMDELDKRRIVCAFGFDAYVFAGNADGESQNVVQDSPSNVG